MALAVLCGGWVAATTGNTSGAASGGAGAVAHKTAQASTGPVFDARQLDIHLSRLAGNVAQQPWQVQLSGAGQSSYSRNGKTWSLPYAAKDAVALLNALYAIRFFDLPQDYSSQDVAQLRADGSVVVLQRFTSNSNLNRLCVRIAAVEKCVAFGQQAPAELVRIFEHQYAEAERLVGLPADGK